MLQEKIHDAVLEIASEYHIKRVVLFGSQANGTSHEGSDVDLMIEFSAPVSLLVLSEIRLYLEDALGVEVDVIHGPIQDSDLIEINEEVEVYAA